ncbi:MAG: hypothetical protein RR540_05560 [Oscillospiraceae bacterium]
MPLFNTAAFFVGFYMGQWEGGGLFAAKNFHCRRLAKRTTLENRTAKISLFL